MGGSLIATRWEIHMLNSIISKKHTFREEFKKYKYMLKDILATVIYVFILLIIAAAIESTITPLLLSIVSV